MMRSVRLGLWSLFLIPAAVPAAPVQPVQPVITGTVLAEGGRPLAGAQVELLPVLPAFEQARRGLDAAGEPVPATIATSDAAGRFSLRAPELGVWKVVVRSADRVPVQQALLPLAGPVELAPAVLLADAGASLHLTDAAGRPLAGARVAVSGPDAPAGGGWRVAPRSGRTDPEGSLRLPRHAGELLELSVFAPSRAEIVRGGFEGGTIQLPAGGEVWQDVRLADRSGGPVAGALAGLGASAWPAGPTDARGRLRLPVSPREPARLRWLIPDGRQANVQWPPPAPDAPARTVTLADPVALSGQVLDAGSRKPVPGALVWAALDPGSFVRTDGQGRFRLPSPMRRRLDLEVLAPGYLPKRATIPGPQLAAGRSTTLVLAQAGTVLGQVVDPMGRPISGAAVVAVAEAAVGDRAFDPSDPVADRAFTDARGRFALRLLRPEEGYEVRASRSGSFPAAQSTVVGAPAASPRNLTLVLAPARSARGRVQDPDGRPVAGAEAVVRPALRPGQAGFSLVEEGEDGLDGTIAASDAQGVFSFPECPAAEVELVVRKKGFAPAVFPALRILPGIGPAGTGPADLGLVTLRPGARLTGRVVDRRDRGVPGAEIFPLDRPLGYTQAERALHKKKPAATTAADGSFTIEDLARGTPVHLIVRAPGYLTAEVRAVRPPTAQPLRIRLEPEAALRGRVVDEAGEPVSGARLDLRWQDHLPEDPERRIGEPVLRSAQSAADGRFELREIPEGSVSLGVSAAGFVALEELELVLPRPADAGELKLVLERGAILQGRVTSAAGEPVPAVRVAVEGAAAATDDDGLYWLEGAEPGPHDVLFIHPRYGRLEKPFDIQPGVNVLDVSFDPGVDVSGRVVDETGKPVPGARVELGSRGRGARQYQDVTGDDGRFRFSPVADGTYRLQAEAPGYSPTEAPGAVEIAGAPVANLEIALERGAVLSGKILGLSPEDLAGVEVEARGDLGVTVAAWTDGRGNYEIRPLRPGDWVIRASLWDGQRQAKVRLVVRRTDREITRDIEFEPRLTLTALVLYDDEPLPGAKLSLRGQRVAAERIATTDYEGRVRIDDLLPDTYRLGVSHPGKMLVHNDQIDLQHDRDMVIRLETSTIAGLVVNKSDGEPVANALVVLKPVEGPEFMVTSGTKADGRFGLYRVPPGHYQLTASAEGFTPVEQPVAAVAGETVDNLELRLTPAEGARIQVRLASGQIPDFVHLLVRDPAGAAVLAETRRTDESGTVNLSKLPAGAWTLALRADGGALATVQLLVPSEPLSVTLAPAGTLSVRVPALGASDLLATVRLVGTDQQPFWTLAPGGQIEQQWTLTGGRGTIEGVPAGAWLIQVESSDGQRWQGAAVTTGAAVTSVTVE